jgi:hypothetical protein
MPEPGEFYRRSGHAKDGDRKDSSSPFEKSFCGRSEQFADRLKSGIGLDVG